MDFNFVQVDGFTPSVPAWSTVGNISSVTPDATGRNFLLTFGNNLSLQLTVLGPRAFRLRFNPAPGAVYTTEYSVAVVSRDLGLAGLNLNTNNQPGQLSIDTGSIRIQVSLTPFSISVFRGAQLIHSDFPNEGVLYIPNQQVIAVTKTAPSSAFYFGCGEKPGSLTTKNGFSFNFFNFDNFTYTGESFGQTSGPLNPTEPLYCSIPFLIETNPSPAAPFAGGPYSYGIFLDNTAQTFINVEAQIGTGASNKYYLGSLYNELDYYFFAGDSVPDVLGQYTTLTGRSPMPPRYVFGLHQGAYGYYDQYKLAQAASSYRAARIPCDGLHIDVDFQDNYRTFTHSEIKFPNAAQLFQGLHVVGFKMSTNITPIITTNSLDENGAPLSQSPYVQQQALQNANALIANNFFDQQAAPPGVPYEGGVNYGFNRGNNPYVNAYPNVRINSNGLIPLTAPGNYPDFGLTAARTAWGQQYSHLLNDLGLDMIWQDMTCPALDGNVVGNLKTFPQNLLMARETMDSAGNVTAVEQLPNAMLHNSYVLNLLRATWAGINALRPNTRNFIIARGGYAGMQRYAALWTGDSASTWDFLRINIPEVLNIGLSGVPISGCDIGGFAAVAFDGIDTFSQSSIFGEPFVAASVSGGVTNYELLTRWMQLGSFLPWYRNHYDGYNKQFQEPYAYGEPVPSNCRKYVELRYRMMQVYYDAMYHWTQTGMPIARALFLNDPGDSQVYSNLSNQFYVGGDFLVAPITDPHDCLNPPTPPTRSIYLPAGSNWYQFMDNTSPIAGAITGGQTISVTADISMVPIYIRAGAILPFCQLEQWVGELPANPLTFNFYPGPDRSTDAQAYLLYQDDGVTTQANTGTYRLSRIYQQTLQNGASVTRQARIARVQGQDNFAPAAGFFFVAIIGSITSPQTVTRDGAVLPNVGDPTTLNGSTVDAWYWNSSIQIAFAKIIDNRTDTTITFNY
jgi:alpha-glucosidase